MRTPCGQDKAAYQTQLSFITEAVEQQYAESGIFRILWNLSPDQPLQELYSWVLLGAFFLSAVLIRKGLQDRDFVQKAKVQARQGRLVYEVLQEATDDEDEPDADEPDEGDDDDKPPIGFKI